MTHYRMSFDDWLLEARSTVSRVTESQWASWKPGWEDPGRILHHNAADYVRDCIANQTVRDIDGSLP